MKSYLIPILAVLLLISCGKKVTSNSKNEPLTFHIVEKGETKKKDKKDQPEPKAPSLPFFTVTGLEGSWTLDISASEIRFKTDNELENITAAYIKPVISDGNVKTYKVKSGETFLNITISEGDCFDENAQIGYNHVVRVSIKRPGEEIFTDAKGCGSYVPDDRLNVVWALKEIKGKAVTANDFGSELPYMDLHTDISQFTGFAGCNRMKGKLFISEGNQLKFVEVITTRMACLGNNRENDFLKAFEAATQYEIRDNLLYLYNPKEALLVFVKSKPSKVD